MTLALTIIRTLMLTLACLIAYALLQAGGLLPVVCAYVSALVR